MNRSDFPFRLGRERERENTQRTQQAVEKKRNKDKKGRGEDRHGKRGDRHVGTRIDRRGKGKKTSVRLLRDLPS